MPVDLTSQISIWLPTTVDEVSFVGEAARIREIEALEAANFALRDQITRLKLHNATLGRMLEGRDGSTGGSTSANSLD